MLHRLLKRAFPLWLALLLAGCGAPMELVQEPDGWEPGQGYGVPAPDAGASVGIDLGNGITVPAWDGQSAWTEVNGGEPYFTEGERACLEGFELYSELDALGRCGAAYVNVCSELMPTEERGDIGSVRPSGWHTVKYNDLIEGNYLYNRCHLIGYQLSGENANEKNLITGTRFLNINGMLDLENSIAGHVKETGGHVLYRVSPVFLEDELVCRGLLIEAFSVEDGGKAVRECRFAWNVQPGIEIDYATGESRRADGQDQAEIEYEIDYGEKRDYVVNLSSGKIHLPECSHAESIKPENRLEMREGIGKLHEAGYTDCGACRPGS